MSTEGERERLSVLETKVDRQGKDITEVKGDVKTLLTKFDIVLGLRNEIDNLKDEILELKQHRFQTNWLYPTLSAAGGALLAVLMSAALHKP